VTPAKDLKTISFVMPVLNEERHLANAVKSIFSQENVKKDEIEVILALGPSTDATNQVAEELKSHFQVKTVNNPSGKTAAGLNLAIAKSSNDIIIRVDAHSELSPNYANLAREILNRTGAANVGGVMQARGKDPFQSAVAYAYNSRLGLGGGTYHVGGQAGPSDSVYLGVFRREVLGKVGGFDENLIRGQDWELNLRLRESGEVVWFDPRLSVGYYPRSSFRDLAKQFYSTGAWRASLTKKHLNKANLRYFAPPALVLASVLGLFSTFFGFFTPLGLIPVTIYMAIVLLASIFASKLRLTSRLLLAAVLPTMHFSWGAGFIGGLFTKR